MEGAIGHQFPDNVWELADQLLASSRLVIDRPAGSRHPRFTDYVYPVDYGYIENTTGGDAEGVDVWVGSMSWRRTTAIACTIDPLKHNAEVKLCWGCDEADLTSIERFYDQQPQAALVIRRPAPGAPR